MTDILTATGGRPVGNLPRATIRAVGTDSRAVPKESLFVAIRGQRHDGHAFVAQALERGAHAAVVSSAHCGTTQALRDRLILVEDTVRALGHLAAWHRARLRSRVIAVTGTNGKTTTKTMIGHVLQARFRGQAAVASYNNHIGVPLTLLGGDPGDDFLVSELGTSAAGEIDHLARLVRPDIAVITSVGLAHLAGLGDLRGVVREKLSLLNHLPDHGLAVVNIDHRVLREQLAQLRPATLLTFGFHHQADLRLSEVRAAGGRLDFRIRAGGEFTLPVPGRHNALNALAAVAVARHLQLPDEIIAERLACFELPAMRLNLRHLGGMLVIDDSYNANPSSMRAAIEVLQNLEAPGRRVAIVGDMCELGATAKRLHRLIGRLFASSRVDLLIGVGREAREICDEAGRRRPTGLELLSAADVEELQVRLPQVLRPQDTVLLKGSRAIGLERLLQSWPDPGPRKDHRAGSVVSPL